MTPETAPYTGRTGTKPALTPVIRSYLAAIGAKGGHATKGSTALSLAAKRHAAATWRLRRIRYGPTGRRQPWQIKAAKMQPAQERSE